MDRRRGNCSRAQARPPQLSSACTRIAAPGLQHLLFSYSEMCSQLWASREGSLGVDVSFPKPYRGAGGGPIPRS